MQGKGGSQGLWVCANCDWAIHARRAQLLISHVWLGRRIAWVRWGRRIAQVRWCRIFVWVQCRIVRVWWGRRIVQVRWGRSTRDFLSGPKPPCTELPPYCSHLDLWGLLETLFGCTFESKWRRIVISKKWQFLMVEWPIFWPFFTKSGPPKAQMS